MDKEMMARAESRRREVGPLTGEDHTPEFLAECEACAGQGYISETVHIYEAGCGFSHPDVVENPCPVCRGDGWILLEAENDNAHGR